MSQQTNHSFGGLKIHNETDISYGLFCELCRLLLLDPVQLICCGTRLCRWCSERGVPDSEPFTCKFCHTTEPKKQASPDRGAARELNSIKIECYSCSWHGFYNDYKKHLQDEHAFLECSDCHERFSCVNLFEEHRQEICEHRCLPCGLPGCKELTKWSSMGEHYLTEGHQRLIFDIVLQYHIWKTRGRNDATSINSSGTAEQELIAFSESIDNIRSTVNNSLNECARLTSEHDQIRAKAENFKQQANEVGKIFQSNDSKINNCIQNEQQMEKQIDDTKKLYTEKMYILNTNSTIIHRFTKHPQDMNAPFSISSPVFKTCISGYNFILRVASTIISGSEHQQYLSIYLTLVRGDFDPILFYPFPYGIHLRLCDQSRRGKDIKGLIKPEENLSSFIRPTSGSNEEVGIVQFCPLSWLKDPGSTYLRDGVFFIEIYIDFLNTGSFPVEK